MPDKPFQIRVTTPGAPEAQAAFAGIAQQADKVAASAGAVTAGSGSAAEATGRFVDAAGRLREANGRFVEMGGSAKKAAGDISDASHEADHLIATLKTGVGIDLGHRIIEGIAEVPRAFREAIAEGVQFNQQMESLGLNLAGAFRAAAPERYLNFSAAQAEGTRALDLLREKANSLGLDMHALGESLSINLASLTHAGVTDLEKQVNLVTLLQQVTASKGISGFQATRDIIDLLNGQANRTILGKELEPLGVNNESIKQAKEQGELYEFLTSKFGAYTEAAGAYANTFAAAQQRLKNETEQLYSEISRPVFEALKEAYVELAAEIQKPEVREGLRAIGYDVATVVSAGAGLLSWAVQNAGALTTLGEALGVAALAWAAFKAAAAASVVGGRTAAWVAETLAIGENTVALEANAAARGTVNAAGAVGAAEGAGVISAEAATATGVTIGTAVAGVLQGAAALAIGLAIGTAIRERITGADDAKLTDASNESISRTDRLNQLRDQISSASTDEEKGKRRKELQDLISQAQNQLSRKQVEPGEDYGEGGVPIRSEAQQTAIDQLESYLKIAERLRDTFDQIAGKNPLADPKVKRDRDALQRYYDSPEGMLADAETSGDEEAISRAKFQEGVEKRKKHLMSGENPLSDEDAQREAEQQELAAEKLKENAEQAKELAKQLREAGKELEHIGSAAAKDADQAAADGRRLADEAKQRQDTLQNENDKLAILRAQAAGNDDLAASLQKQVELRQEITRLMREGLTYDEASARATEEQNLNQQIKDAQFKKDHANDNANSGPALAFRPGETPAQYHARTGGIDARPKDTDPDGWVHGGEATSTAGALLAGEGFSVGGVDPRDRLNKPFVFPDDPAGQAGFTSGFDGWGYQAPTAVAALVPIAGRINPPASSTAGKADAAPPAEGADGSALASAAQETARSAGAAKDAAGKSGGSLDSAATDLRAAANSLDGLAGKFSEQDGKISNLAGAVSALQSAVNNLINSK